MDIDGGIIAMKCHDEVSLTSKIVSWVISQKQ